MRTCRRRGTVCVHGGTHARAAHCNGSDRTQAGCRYRNPGNEKRMTESSWFMLKALFLGLIEGFTEFIPVSSTAHLLLIGDWINFSSGDDKVFAVVIQFGSILAAMWIFRARLWQLIRSTLAGERSEVMFMRNLFIAFLPAAIIGAIMIKHIKALFHSPAVFVFTLIIGGLIMLWVERKPQYAKFGSQ